MRSTVKGSERIVLSNMEQHLCTDSEVQMTGGVNGVPDFEVSEEDTTKVNERIPAIP